MTADELERAVTEPARLAGLQLEPGLVELVLRDVAGEPGRAAAALARAARDVGAARRPHAHRRRLPRERRRRVGDRPHGRRRGRRAARPSSAGSRAASSCGMTELGEGIDGHAPAGGDRRARPRGRVARRRSDALLERLADARLVTLGDGTAEVAHEALIREWPRLRRWLDEDRAGIRAHRQLGDAARVWEAGGRETVRPVPRRPARRRAELRSRPRRAQRDRARLPRRRASAEAERERRAERRANRRLRGLLAAATVLLVVAIAGAVLSLVSRSNARTAAPAPRRRR